MTNPTDNPFADRGAGPDAGPAEAAAADGFEQNAFDDAVDADAAAQAEADEAEAGDGAEIGRAHV